MKRTYILVLKCSLVPWKDLRLAVFMFVRIMYLKEKGIEEALIIIDHRISTVLIW